MSFLRLIYLSSLIGGWSAFIGWLFTEIPLGRMIDQDSSPTLATFLAILMACLVAVPIGGGISVASALANPSWLNLLKHFLIGCAGGLCGGLLGSLPGMCIFALLQNIPVFGFVGRVLGWTLIGVGIGVGMGAMEGLFDRNMKKIRNGLIGGVIGGFLGGLFFVPVAWIIQSPISSRAFAFVMLGLCVGLFIGLAQVILKEAWLTVEQGFRPGRQMILSGDLVTMGTSEKSSLIFIAFGAKGVEPTHLRIVKQTDGYFLEDNQSRTGTFLNGAPVSAPTRLLNGDAIQLGVNVVRFHERERHGAGGQPLPPPVIVKEGAIKDGPAPVRPQPTNIKEGVPVASSAVQGVKSRPAPVPAPARPAAPVAVAKPAPAKPAHPAAPSQPAPKPAPPVEATPQEGRCPICDKKVVGIPGKRRCKACFTSF